jgi:glycosyltransferase involved in cell wall biosynthesis
VDRGRDVRFLMVGGLSVEQNYQSDMKSLASQLNLGDRVIFTGERRNISEILREVDIVVHPSLTEGLSNVILEAMAASVPVVATRVGGNPELVEHGHNGLLVAAQNAAEIADAVSSLLDQPEMARSFGERDGRRLLKSLLWSA